MSDSGFERRRLLKSPLLLLPALTGCNRNRKKLIGVVPMGRAHVFWQSVHAGAVKAAQETGVDIEWNGPAAETDKSTQLQIVEAMINKRVDAICVAPIDSRALVNPVERATREGIPVIVFDSGVDTDVFIARVATDNYRGGQIAAERIGQILGGKGKIAMVATMAGAASTTAREKGFEDFIRQHHPGIEIVDKRFGDAEVAKSLRVTENMLTAHPEVVALFASNETSTAGAAQALKARQSSVKLVGFDASPALVSDLRAGTIDSLIVQHPFKMGYDSVQAAVKKLGGQPVEKIQNMAPRLVTRENLDQPDVREQIQPDLKKYLG